MFIQSLHIYPLKGAKGTDLTSCELTSIGLLHDRMCMLIDGEGNFVSQRTEPRLATIEVSIDEHILRCRVPGHDSIDVDLSVQVSALDARIWEDTVLANECSRYANQYFSDALSRHVRLVYLPKEHVRQSDLRYAQVGDRVRLADAYALLIATEASRADVEQRVGSPIPMTRFRPNIVIGGASAWDEDHWRSVNVADVRIRIVKPCARCNVINVDQQTADVFHEPLKTLASFRARENKVYFGQNAVPDAIQNRTVLSVGMPISIERVL